MYGVPSSQFGSSAPTSALPSPTSVADTSPPPMTSTYIPPSAPAEPVPLGFSWNEIQTADGRVFYSNSSTGARQWLKPEELMTPSELVVLSTNWRQYKIWDGRSYYFNEKTKCSVWATPPEVLLAQAELGAPIDPELIECESFDRRNKTHADCRREFYDLLVEKNVSEHMTFSEAMSLISSDMRFHALATPQSKQTFFASYISNLIKLRVQAQRDTDQEILREGIRDLQNWKGMSQSATFSEMKKKFSGSSWFTSLGELEARKLFQLFSVEYMEVDKLEKQKLQDTLMQELKLVLLANSGIDFSAETMVDDIYSLYANCDEPYWSTLSDSQKLIVFKSCVNQRIREARLAVINNVPLSLAKRKLRKDKDSM